jgi:hypothetical protein
MVQKCGWDRCAEMGQAAADPVKHNGTHAAADSDSSITMQMSRLQPHGSYVSQKRSPRLAIGDRPSSTVLYQETPDE